MKRIIKFTLAVSIAVSLFALLYVVLGTSERKSPDWIPVACAQGGCCAIVTGNEDVPPGDWDATYIFQGPTGGITRTAFPVQEGSYSYQHHSYCAVGTCIATTYITCSFEMASGWADAWFYFDEEVGSQGAQARSVMRLGWFPSQFRPAWDVYYHYGQKRLRVHCENCEPEWPEWDYGLGHMITGTWHHVRIEWDNFVADGTDGVLKGWMDDQLYFDEQNIVMDTAGDWEYVRMAGVGVIWWGSPKRQDVYVDTADISSCTPTPVPTPEPGDCNQYGHAGVLNVDNDCSAIVRFNAVPGTVPRDSRVERATLLLYGVAMEVAGETINVAPLNVLWGEATCDWCRRSVAENWALPGATAVPQDRNPGKVAEFTTALGEISIDLPPYLIENWALTYAANPGVILSSEELTGKFGIASSEWVDSAYAPQLRVYYTMQPTPTPTPVS